MANDVLDSLDDHLKIDGESRPYKVSKKGTSNMVNTFKGTLRDKTIYDKFIYTPNYKKISSVE